MNGRLNLLSTVLLALGAVDLPPPPRKEVDLAEAEQVMRDLAAAGINVHDLAAAVKPEDFVVMGRAVLQLQRLLRSVGEVVVDAQVLLDRIHELVRPTASEQMDSFRNLASFGEPVDSKDIAGGAGKSFEPLPDLFAQKHAAMRRRIDADMAARIDRDQQRDVDFTPTDVARQALALIDPPDHFHSDRIEVSEPQTIDLNPAYESGAPTATIGLDGIPLAHVIFDRSKPKLKFNDISTTRPVYTGVDMAAPGRFDRTAITIVTNSDIAAMRTSFGVPAEGIRAETPVIRDREAQRAAKKTRARAKAKRGY